MVTKKEKETFIASKSTLWLLFLPLATVTSVSIVDQVMKDFDCEIDTESDK